MASKIKVTPQKEEMLEKEGPETPLLDLSDAAVRELIRSAKKRGYVTHDQITTLLSSEEVKSEQIEDILAMFSEMGVNVVETEEAEPEDEGAREEPDDEEERVKASWSRSSPSSRPRPSRRNSPSAPTTPSACICVKWALRNFFPARARSPSPSASRLAARP